MAKRVATKSRKMWAIVQNIDGTIYALRRSRSLARGCKEAWDSNVCGMHRVEPVMVTPIKRKAKP